MAPVKLVFLYILFCSHRASGRHTTSTVRSFKPDDQSEEVTSYALYKSYTNETKHYGVVATMDVYGLAITRGQDSGAAIWVGNPGDDPAAQTFIIVGWHVRPSLYGDSSTRFFVYWTEDGFRTTGCYNMACPGFQPETGAHVSPGDVISPVSESGGTKQSITIKIYKANDTGDWWVYYGSNGPAVAVGHFPKSLLSGLEKLTVDFAFGGYVSNERTETTPPMGSGSNEAGKAASFSGLQYVLPDGTVSPVTGDLPSRTDKKSCYPVTPIVNGKFFYGGPAGCAV